MKQAIQMTSQTETLDWLMAGDPAIRWQTLRDLKGASRKAWQAERGRTVTEGWGARLMARQARDDTWGGGLYSPKWTSSTYTLLTLISIGIPRDCEAAQRGARVLLDGMLGKECDAQFAKHLVQGDQCIWGMLLQIAAYFGIEDARIEALVDDLLNRRIVDGAWNCRCKHKPIPKHSSFHTTLNALDGLREYADTHTGQRRKAILAAEQEALELLLQHRLFKSDHTYKVIDYRFELLSFPPRWHYDLLRGLDYFARVDAAHDPRLQDAIDVLCERRRADGLWPVQHKHPGLVYFDMEKTGGPSRWNTLRALRVLKWWEGDSAGD